ncbi:MAG: T9SS type A sorting domain-containing protein [Saprospiraceae bacterium]|nr:T9SS type A sorting domain-containing protein [Saprospiraceae bacterium]
MIYLNNRFAAGLSLITLFFFLFSSCQSFKNNGLKETKVRAKVTSSLKVEDDESKPRRKRKHDMYDGPDQAAALEFKQTRDLSLGYVPTERLLQAIEITERAKKEPIGNRSALTPLSWTERGPYSDVVGPSNGNTRQNNAITAGRIRAVWVDLSDNTGKTVFVGGVNGGIWKTTDITASAPNWTLVNDYLSNLAVTSICQDPTNPNIMYFSTGEAFFNADAAQGVGVFKSTDGGNTWSLLSSTSSYVYCSKILCDASGNVYLSTRGTGFLRSTNGGSTWTNITPTGVSQYATDFEISSTGRLHLSVGQFSIDGLTAYRYTDVPAIVTSSSGWTAATTAFPTGQVRCELACSGNTVYAVQSTTSYSITQIHKSTDGGATWTTSAITSTNTGYFGSQAWYDIAFAVDPTDANTVILGGVQAIKSTNGGSSFSKISEWVGTTGQYVHADMHNIAWYDGGNKLIIVSDGGVFYSTDKGATFRDRNTNLRLKQFYSVAIHPTSTNYFLAGAQDNGNHQLNGAGLTTSTEVTGGDGAFVAIDQNEPQYQFGAYVYNQYRRSTNGGNSWSSVNVSTSAGMFINPWDYDDKNNAIYASHNAGRFLRWINPASATTTSNILVPNFNGAFVSAVKVSPYTDHLVYFGTEAGRIVKIANANVTASAVATNITSASMPANAYVSCINVGTDDNNLIVSFSNYGANSIWRSTDGGATWTSIEGNMPDIPVRWVMFFPNDNTKAYAGTEAGVWETDLLNGSSTVWVPNSTFPTTRATQLKYRASDHTIVASTHGRGIWTATVPVPTADITITTAPVGLSITVDGNSYTSPKTFTWDVNTNHTIATTSPQTPTDANHTFSNWSDAGAISHTITVPASPTTYTATFASKYQLTTGVNNSVCGSITPASGMYDAGNVVITATPAQGYSFSGFTGGLTGTTNPQTLNLTTPTTVTASFSIPVSVSLGATSNAAVCSGAQIIFTATPTNGGTTPQYKWYKNNVEIVGEIGSTYQSSSLANGDVIKVELTSNVPCAANTTATDQKTVTIYTVAFGTPSVTNVSCNGGNNGRVVVLATGGNGTKTYSIAPSVGTQSPSGTFNNLTPQTYTFTATDASGCTATTTATVSQPTAITFGTPTVTNVKCAGGNSGRVVVSATGGTGAITYTISPSGGSQSPSGTFNNLTARTYTFTATDANGCTKTTTATVSTSVNQLPTVNLTAPANGATVVTNTTLSATASDPDGTISRVNFYWVVGNTKTGTISRQLLGTDNSAPYTYDWLNMPGGNYNIQAEAVDDCNETTFSSIANINVLETFTVALTTSLNGQTFAPGSNLTLTASVVAFTSRTVAKVEFFAGNVKLGEDLTAPYTYAWNNVASGNYTLRAVVTDNLGGVWYSPYTYVLSVNTNRATPQGQLGATIQQNVEDFMLYQNQPNPVSNETIIGFNLPKDGSARLTITTIDGRVVKVINGEYKAGFNAISINKAELRVNGVFYYSLETAGQSASKKMVVLE